MEDLNIYIEGRAIVLDLSKSPIVIAENPTVKKPHMTILFKPSGFAPGELDRVRASAKEWMKWNLTPDIDTGKYRVDFRLEKWGPRSMLVKGQLEAMGQHLRDMYGPDQDRPLHVELFKDPKYVVK